MTDITETPRDTIILEGHKFYPMKYEEILNIVNRFLETTGLRKYCQKVCRGGCCSYCSQNTAQDTTPLHTKCNQRLPCVIFKCHGMEDILSDAGVKLWFIDAWTELHNYITDKTDKVLYRKYGKLKGGVYYGAYHWETLKDEYFWLTTRHSKFLETMKLMLRADANRHSKHVGINGSSTREICSNIRKIVRTEIDKITRIRNYDRLHNYE